jgi:hypothetical protein
MALAGERYWLFGLSCVLLTSSTLILWKAFNKISNGSKSRLVVTIQKYMSESHTNSANSQSFGADNPTNDTVARKEITFFNFYVSFLASDSFVLSYFKLLWLSVLIIGFVEPTGLHSQSLSSFPQAAWVCLLELSWIVCVAIYFLLDFARFGSISDNFKSLISKYTFLGIDNKSNTAGIQLRVLSDNLAAIAEISFANFDNDIKSRIIGLGVIFIWILSCGAAALAAGLTSNWEIIPCFVLLVPACSISIAFTKLWITEYCCALPLPIDRLISFLNDKFSLRPVLTAQENVRIDQIHSSFDIEYQENPIRANNSLSHGDVGSRYEIFV